MGVRMIIFLALCFIAFVYHFQHGISKRMKIAEIIVPKKEESQKKGKEYHDEAFHRPFNISSDYWFSCLNFLHKE